MDMSHRISAPSTDPGGLLALRPMWIELHRHHLEVALYRDLVTDLDASWARRANLYQRILAQDGFYLTATDDRDGVIGYAMVAIEGEDDTFDTDRGIAEVVTLAVTAGHRSSGVGRALLEAAERVLLDRRIDTVKIAVMHGNSRAEAFYGSRGYVRGEVLLYRRIDPV